MQAYQENISAKVSGVLSPILGVSVTVTDTATGLPATLYSDNGVTQIAQPLVTDETGYFSFYAANGSYTVKFSSPQIAVGTRKIELYDRDDDAPLTQAQAASPTGASSIGYGQRTVANKLDDIVSVRDFGAVGNGVTDDTAALQAAINAAYAKGGGAVDLSGGRWLVDSANLTVKQGVTLQGPWRRAGEIEGRNYLDFKGAITLNPAYTINLAEDFAAIDGVVIVRKGITVPTDIASATAHVAAFAGTAITVGNGTSNKANDTFAGHCLIIGFNYAYYNDYNERADVQYLSGDCTNGVYMNRVYDMDHLVGCHFWPYTTTHQSWTFSGDAGWRRQGTAFYFGLGVDWGQAIDCFSYGYDKGFDVNGSDNVVLLNCGADGWKNNNAYSIGYHARGTTKNLNLLGCKSASKNTSVLVDLTGGGTSQCVKITGGNLWAASTGTGSHVYVKNGNAIVSGGASMFDGPVGVKSDSTAGVIEVAGAIFQTVAAPFALANYDTAIINSNIYNGSTDSTAGRRHVSDNQHAATYDAMFNGSVAGLSAYMRKARGSAAAPTIIQANDAPYVLNYQGWDGAAWQTMAQSRAQVQGTPSAGVMPGAIIWSTNNGSGLADRVAIHNSGSMYPVADSTYSLGFSASRWSNVYAQNVTLSPPASVTPAINGQMMFELTSDTTVKVKVKGSDGVVRSATLTLA